MTKHGGSKTSRRLKKRVGQNLSQGEWSQTNPEHQVC